MLILQNRDQTRRYPRFMRALLKNEQDVHLLERLAFMHRRESQVSTMLINFFHGLRRGYPVTRGVAGPAGRAGTRHIAFGSMDEFYLSVGLHSQDESISTTSTGLSACHSRIWALDDVIEALIPDDWLRSEFMKNLSEDKGRKIESWWASKSSSSKTPGRAEKSATRAATKWIGTGGTSPFGQEGYPPRVSASGPTGTIRRR